MAANTRLLADVTVDEIALEGMDGLTLDALWTRLAERLAWPQPLHPKVQQTIWHFICQSESFEFYELTAERPPLRTFDRNDYDPQSAQPNGPAPFTMYAFREVDLPAGVDGRTSPVRGSCQDWDTRRGPLDAIAELQPLSVAEAVERWGSRLVVAATQGVREAALIPDSVSVDTTLSLHQFCLLERIGRARWNGEATSGRFPLNEYNQFHVR